MSALALEERMAVDDRIAKLESDVRHLRADVAEIKADRRQTPPPLQSEIAKEFGSMWLQREGTEWWIYIAPVAALLSLLASTASLVRVLTL